jgi:lipid-A-disaccharide synthase
MSRAQQPSKRIVVSNSARDLRLFMIAGEHSGDHLGAQLMAAINAERRGHVRYLGVGGAEMAAHGLTSQFALSDIAVMGPIAIAKRLPRLVRRVYQTANAAVAAEPDAVVIIDAPEFTHAVAKRFRRRQSAIPIINYVSPSVWAWRPGRAKRMRRYVDHIMALLPFEPGVHERLGGPPCTYVGHPLIERIDWIRSRDPMALAARLGLDAAKPVIVLLPGSRVSEVTRLLDPFIAAIAQIAAEAPGVEVIAPVVPTVRPLVAERLASSGLAAHLVEGEEDKFAAFRLARVALAASGTVTLELALAGTPMVVGYKVDAIAAPVLRRLITANTITLPNLVIGENIFCEFIQEQCTSEALADAMRSLIADGPVRDRQLAGLERIPDRMRLDGLTPSEAAATLVLEIVERCRRDPRRSAT